MNNDCGTLSCCDLGHDKHHLLKSRDYLGRFQEKPVHQTDIPEQCYLCKDGYHHHCVKPEDCGCDCADFIEDTTKLTTVD